MTRKCAKSHEYGLARMRPDGPVSRTESPQFPPTLLVANRESQR